jgi:hypothetical protein
VVNKEVVLSSVALLDGTGTSEELASSRTCWPGWARCKAGMYNVVADLLVEDGSSAQARDYSKGLATS